MTFSAWISLGSLGLTVLSLICGAVYGYGKLNEAAMTKQQCGLNQESCAGATLEKIEELKELVLTLHSDHSAKIEEVEMHRLSDKDKFQNAVSKIERSLGRLEGGINFLIKGNKI